MFHVGLWPGGYTGTKLHQNEVACDTQDFLRKATNVRIGKAYEMAW